MNLTSTISQLSSIKNLTVEEKCWVFCEFGVHRYKWQIHVNEETIAQTVLLKAVNLLEQAEKDTLVAGKDSTFQLYASKKSGKRPTDLPSLSLDQPIMQTGTKYFYLFLKRYPIHKSSSTQPKSIISSMKCQSTPNPQILPQKQPSYFCA